MSQARSLRFKDRTLYNNWQAESMLRERGIRVHRCAERHDTDPIPRFDSLADLKSYRESGWDLGMGVASSLISASRWSAPDVIEYRPLIERMVRAARLTYRNVATLCGELGAVTVVLFNGRFVTSRAVLRAAQALGIEAVIHERGCDKNHYELFDFLPHDLGRWSQHIAEVGAQQDPASLAEAANQFYRRRRAGYAKDWHSFVSWEQDNLGEFEYLRALKPVVYFSSSDDEWAAIGDVLPQPLFENQIEGVLHLADICQANRLPLVVRIHPHLASKHPADLQFWRSALADKAIVIDAAQKVDSYALMELASLCVTYGSTAGIESTYWGRPHVLLGRAMYEGLPGVHRPASLEAIQDHVLRPRPVDQAGALCYGGYTETFGIPFRRFTATSLDSGSIFGITLSRRIRYGEAAGILRRRLTRWLLGLVGVTLARPKSA